MQTIYADAAMQTASLHTRSDDMMAANPLFFVGKRLGRVAAAGAAEQEISLCYLGGTARLCDAVTMSCSDLLPCCGSVDIGLWDEHSRDVVGRRCCLTFCRVGNVGKCAGYKALGCLDLQLERDPRRDIGRQCRLVCRGERSAAL
jgi:hypothetical protein